MATSGTPGKCDTIACDVPAAGAGDVQRGHEALRRALRQVVVSILAAILWLLSPLLRVIPRDNPSSELAGLLFPTQSRARARG